jgi:hypothetical protein
MPATNTRNDILTAIRTGLLEVSGLHADRVLIRRPAADEARADNPVVFVHWYRDHGMRKDGNKRERELIVIVGAFISIDRSKAQTQLMQLSEFYDQVHAQMEALAESDLDSTVLSMVEQEPGIMPDPDAAQLTGYISCGWRITYIRNISST